MKAKANIVVMMVAAVLPSIVFAGSLFPQNPVPMTEGYGKDGAGTHFAVPEGVPGPDCVVNPVSFKWYETTEKTVRQVEVQKVVPGDVFSIPANILFDFDKDELRPAGKVALDELSAKLKELGVLEITIIGHTDAKGTEEYNFDLGARRAVAVEEYLFDLSAHADYGIVYNNETRGESEPVAPNEINGRDNPAGRQLNRRVDLRVDRSETVVVELQDVTEEKVVRRERNPQIFHVLASGNKVYCGADVTFFGPQLFWWGYN